MTSPNSPNAALIRDLLQRIEHVRAQIIEVDAEVTRLRGHRNELKKAHTSYNNQEENIRVTQQKLNDQKEHLAQLQEEEQQLLTRLKEVRPPPPAQVSLDSTKTEAEGVSLGAGASVSAMANNSFTKEDVMQAVEARMQSNFKNDLSIS